MKALTGSAKPLWLKPERRIAIIDAKSVGKEVRFFNPFITSLVEIGFGGIYIKEL